MALTKISTDGVKDDAVTAGKIPAGAVGSSELANNSVVGSKIAQDAVGGSEIAANAISTGKIADEAVTLAKLEHGTSSNDGKFLRANNGADPTFETVTGTTINSNADNRLITGSGTANTLNGESNLTYDGSVFSVTGKFNPLISIDNATTSVITNNGANGGNVLKLTSGGTGAGTKIFQVFKNNQVSETGVFAIDGAGDVGIGTTSPQSGGLTVENSSESRVQLRAGSSGSNGILALRADGTNTQLGTWSNHDLKIVRNNSNKISITADGLTFNGDTASANALDDYEEGTFVPSWGGATYGSTSISYGTTNGANYIKVGHLVMVTGRTDITGVTGGSGNWYIGNLPYYAKYGTKQYNSVGCCNLENNNLPDDTIDVVMTMEQGNNNVHITTTRDNASKGAGITLATDSNFTIQWSICYHAN